MAKKQELFIVGNRKVFLPEWEEDKGGRKRITIFLIFALLFHIGIGLFFGSHIVKKAIEEARLKEIKIIEEKTNFLNRKPMIQPIEHEQRKEIKQDILKELMKQKTVQPEQMNAKVDEKSIQENLESQARFEETQDENADVIVGITNQKDLSDLLSTEALPAVGGGQFDYVEFFKVEVKPEPIKTVLPEYPEVARKAGLEGRVTVAAIVDENGNVIYAEVINSTNKVFEEPAVKAAYQYKFKPGMMKDRRVKVRVIIPFAFKLQS